LFSSPDASDESCCGFRLQDAPFKHPWAVDQGMDGFDFALLDGQAECSRIDAEQLSGFR
jgi:hypothetical protein